MASTYWYRSALDLVTARATLQEAMKSLGVTRFLPVEDRFTGSDDPMEAHRRMPDFGAQLSNFGIGRQGQMPKNSMVHLRLYSEPTGTTVASGIGITSGFGAAKKEAQFHQGFLQAWQQLDSSLTTIDHPGYLM